MNEHYQSVCIATDILAKKNIPQEEEIAKYCNTF